MQTTGEFVSPRRPSEWCSDDIPVDPPLSTKRERMMRKTPARLRVPPTPRLAKTAPSSGRYYSIRDHYDPFARIVSFKALDQAPRLNKNYSPERGTYLDQCFTVTGRLGQGSFGEVVSVRSNEDGKMFAVKCALDLYRNMSDRRSRLQEVQKHELLPQHPNLVRFIKAWEERGRLYIQTELCKRSLDDIAREHHEIHEPEIWHYLIDILMAINHLHSFDLLHVDIKPANIFVTSNGICKLGDFGLVFDLNRDDPSNLCEGDSKYLAAEVLNDKPTKAADIFSLGITILELATDLELPTNGVFWHEIRKRIIDEKYIKYLSYDLRRVIAWMIDPDPAMRPTASELLDDPVVRTHKLKRQLLVVKHETFSFLSDQFCLLFSMLGLLLYYISYPFVLLFNSVYDRLVGTGHATPYSSRLDSSSWIDRTPDFEYMDSSSERAVLPSLARLNFDPEPSDESH